MIRPASFRDSSRISQLLERANSTPYDIRIVAEEKVFGAGYQGSPEVRVFGDFAGVSVTCGNYLRLIAVDPGQRRRGIGTALLHDAEARGASVVAAEPGNYFTPGIVESDAATLEFLASHGYAETARTQNLVATANGGRQAANVKGDRRLEVLEFIERHFGPIWRFEASHARTVFYVEADDVIAGFATYEANNRGLGFFGPTGVDERYRGRGLGRQLLLASLAGLQDLGYTQIVIPWTDALDFYRNACGAVVAHGFLILRRIAP